MSTRKKRTWRWVTRDPEGAYYSKFIAIHSHHKKPNLIASEFISEDGAILACLKEFKKITGIDIKHGECVKVEFSAKVVK